MVDETNKEDFEEEEIEHDQYIVFMVNAQEFGLQAMRVREISSMFDIAKVPNTSPYIEGIMNLRGNLVTVINIRKKFGFKIKKYDEDTRIIVVEKDDFPIGIIADSVEEVIKIPDDKRQKIHESVSISKAKEYITGVGVLDKRLIVLLDLDKIILNNDLLKAGEITQLVEETVETVEESRNKRIDNLHHTNTEERKTTRREE